MGHNGGRGDNGMPLLLKIVEKLTADFLGVYHIQSPAMNLNVIDYTRVFNKLHDPFPLDASIKLFN
jgi:hypothetical protein